MDRLPMCRICLAENVRLCIVGNRNLHQLYESMTNNSFITEDSRPMLACVFCFAKLKHCYRLLQQCLNAEELFTQKMNDKSEPNPVVTEKHFEIFGGLVKSPIEQINVDDCSAVEEESSTVCGRPDDVIEPKEEYQNDELEPENLDSSCLDVANIRPHCSICKFEVEDEEISKKKGIATETIQLKSENSDNSCLDVANIPPHCYKSDLEDDIPLIKCITEVEDQKISKNKRKARETIKATVVRKPKQETRRTKEKDAITAEQTTKDKSDWKVIRTTQIWTPKPGTYHKEPYICIRGSSNNVKKEYKCHICQRMYKKRDKLTIHMRTHTGEKPYKCDICRRNFSHKSNLTLHMRTHTGEKPYKCNVCHRNFSVKKSLTLHMRTHTGEKPYQCDICQRNFSQKGSLTVHMRAHTGKKPYKCDICQVLFSRKGCLTVHMRAHTGEKPYKCDICQVLFSRKEILTVHMRTHTGEKPYKCDICRRNFSHKSNLTVHMLTHTDEKPYKCNVCHRNFSEKRGLTVHMRKHTGEKPYQCDICQVLFCRKWNLTVHIRAHTGEKPRKNSSAFTS